MYYSSLPLHVLACYSHLQVQYRKIIIEIVHDTYLTLLEWVHIQLSLTISHYYNNINTIFGPNE
jgi:hypothetical protein